MSKYIYEVVETYKLRSEDFEETIHGEIRRELNPSGGERYSWWISHHYRPSQGAYGVYHPSNISGESIDEVRQHMIAYMQGFTAEFEVKAG
jgi:hypothetical protein